MLEGVDPKADVELAAIRLSKLMNRTPEALKKAIIDARTRMVSRVGEYTDIHLEAAKKAAKYGNSKPAEWALEHLKQDGERVIEVITPQADNRVMVHISLPQPLGGSKPTSNELPTVVVGQLAAGNEADS